MNQGKSLNNAEKLKNLEDSIKNRRKTIQVDSYPMSIGEIANLYKDKEINIHPEFQRFYRWSDLQKSKLVDSILLGIPLPSFFVAQNEEGIWEVIDGLQRLATILSFMGLYRNKEDVLEPPLILTKTNYLPNLEGFVWDEEASKRLEVAPYFSNELRLAFKREKIELKIIKKESSKETKYELFNRLNTSGSSLSNQEVRNCMLIMLDKSFYEWLSELSENNGFKSITDLSEKNINEKYDMELVLRYLIFKNKSPEEVKNIPDVGDYITEKMQSELLPKENFDRIIAKDEFEKTFQLLNKALGDGSFKKYNSDEKIYKGSFSLPIFEVMAFGLGAHISSYSEKEEDIEKIKNISMQLPENKDFLENSGSGANISKRLPKLIELGRDLFSKND